MASGTPVFGHFEHKIEVFVRVGGATAGATAGSNGNNRSNVSNWSNVSNRSNGATGTTAGTVWVADILSQRGVV